MDGACSTHGDVRSACKILVGKPEWKRPLRRPGCRWEDNIKIDLMKVWMEGVDLIYLTQE
jgi:hypothetical protein